MAQNLLSYFSKGARNSKKSTSTPRRQRSLLSYHARNIEGVFSVVCWLSWIILFAFHHSLKNFYQINSAPSAQVKIFKIPRSFYL